MNKRRTQAQQILATKDTASQLDPKLYKMRSLSNPIMCHYISRTGHSLVCTCDDRQEPKSDNSIHQNISRLSKMVTKVALKSYEGRISARTMKNKALEVVRITGISAKLDAQIVEILPDHAVIV